MTTETATLRKEIIYREKQYWEAIKNLDTGTLGRLTADQFTMVMEEGITNHSRPEFLEMMSSGDMQLKSYELEEGSATFRELGPGVVLLAYKAQTDFDRGGAAERFAAYYSTIWTKNGGEWRAAAGSASRAEAPR